MTGFKSLAEQEKYWTEIAKKQLLGRKIVLIRYMSKEEAAECGWDNTRPVIMQLDDGNIVMASGDDEGNNGGALFTNNEEQPILPVL